MANREQFAGNMTQQRWLGAVKNLGCVGCHQLGQLSTRTIPPSLGTFASGADAWHRRVQSGQAGDMMFGQLNGLGPASFKYYGDWTDRIAKGELPHSRAEPSAGRRAQHRRHAARLDEREAVPARSHLERSPPSDGQRQRAALRITRVQLGRDADSRSRREQSDDVQDARAGSADAAQPGPGARGSAEVACRVAVLGRRGHLGHAGEQPQLDARSRRARVAGRDGARRRTTPRSAAKARRIRRRSSSRSIARSGTSPCSNRRRRSTRSWTRASARTTSSSATTRTTRSGRAAAARCSDG